jgi:hypothetical protein
MSSKKQKEERMDTERREFLKKSAVGAAAFSIPSLLHSSAIPSAASDERSKYVFQFLDFSDGTGLLSGKSMFMQGNAKFGLSGPVTGGGGYVIADTATFGVVYDFGSWRAKEFVSFTNVGMVAAGYLGGTLTMDVILKSANGGETEAAVTVNCDGGAVLSPATGGGGSGAGDIVIAEINNGPFAGSFGPGSVIPFNVNVIVAPVGETRREG